MFLFLPVAFRLGLIARTLLTQQCRLALRGETFFFLPASFRLRNLARLGSALFL